MLQSNRRGHRKFGQPEGRLWDLQKCEHIYWILANTAEDGRAISDLSWDEQNGKGRKMKEGIYVSFKVCSLPKLQEFHAQTFRKKARK